MKKACKILFAAVLFMLMITFVSCKGKVNSIKDVEKQMKKYSNEVTEVEFIEAVDKLRSNYEVLESDRIVEENVYRSLTFKTKEGQWESGTYKIEEFSNGIKKIDADNMIAQGNYKTEGKNVLKSSNNNFKETTNYKEDGGLQMYNGKLVSYDKNKKVYNEVSASFESVTFEDYFTFYYISTDSKLYVDKNVFTVVVEKENENGSYKDVWQKIYNDNEIIELHTTVAHENETYNQVIGNGRRYLCECDELRASRKVVKFKDVKLKELDLSSYKLD